MLLVDKCNSPIMSRRRLAATRPRSAELAMGHCAGYIVATSHYFSLRAGHTLSFVPFVPAAIVTVKYHC